MKNRFGPALVCLAVAAAAAAALAGGNPPGGPVAPKPAKLIPVTTTLQMRPTKDPLKALRGRVVVLVMFDTYSGSCVAAVPDVNALHDKFGPSGMTILWMNAEEERPKVEEWLKTNAVRSPAAIVDTRTKEDLINREYPAPGNPWAFLIDAKGNVCWIGHPSDPGLTSVSFLTPLLDQATVAPILPESLAEVQPLLDAGTWMTAKAALLAAVEGGKLSKTDVAWAKGVAKWIEMRRTKTIAEGDALEKEGWSWDAWWTFDDYTRRYEGAEGCDVARQKADAIKASNDPAVKLDMKNGDDLARAEEYIAKGKYDAARLTLVRLSGLKTTRFAERAKELLLSVPAKTKK